MVKRLNILASAKTVGDVNVLTIQAKSNMLEGKAVAETLAKITN
jgi:hypothetical protein